MSVIVTEDQMWELFGKMVDSQPEIVLENMGGRAAYGEAYDSMLSNMKYIQLKNNAIEKVSKMVFLYRVIDILVSIL